MDLLGARAHAEQLPELAKASRRQAVAVGEPDLAGLQARAQLPHAGAIARVALVVAAVAIEGAAVGRGIDLVDGPRDRRESAGEEGLAQAVGRDREVAHHAETAEALAEHAPAVDAQLLADQLGVADDRVGAEIREVIRLPGGVQVGEAPDRGRAPRSTLVEQQHPELGQRPSEPSRRRGVSRRAGRLEAGPTLKEHEIGPLETVGVGDLARKHADPLAVGTRVVERHRELPLGDHEPGDPQRAADGRGAPVGRRRLAFSRPGRVSAHRGDMSDARPWDRSADVTDSTIGPSGRSMARRLVNAPSPTQPGL